MGDTPSSGVGDVTTGWITLIAGLAISGFLFWKNHSDDRAFDGFYNFNLMNTAFVLWVPLVIGMLFLRREPADIGFTRGDLGKGALAGLACFVLFSPVILFISSQQASQHYYIRVMNDSGAINVFSQGFRYVGGSIYYEKLIYHELVMGFYMFGWEYYHRGFLLNGLKKIMPLWGAVLLQAALFTALHYGKPTLELISSFPGGIVMGLLAVRFRSFMPCFLLHWFISAGFDFAVLYHHFH